MEQPPQKREEFDSTESCTERVGDVIFQSGDIPDATSPNQESSADSQEAIELTLEERKTLTKAINIAKEGQGIPEDLYNRLVENRKMAELIKQIYFRDLERNPKFLEFRKRMINQALMNPSKPAKSE